MAGGYGFAGHIGFAKETTGGTPVAATNYLEALSEGLTLSVDRFETKNIVGGYFEPDDQAGINRLGGDIVFAAVPTPLGFMLNAVTGIQSNSVVLSGFLNQHVFTFPNSDWSATHATRAHTFEIFRDVTSAQQVAGCCISALSINVAPNQAAQVTMNVIGQSVLSIAKTTPSFVSSPSAPLAFDTCSISIAGTANALIESLNFSIDNQLEGVPTLNNTTKIRTIRRTGPQMVRLSGTLSFEDITEYNNFVNQTEQQFKINLFRASSFALLIDLPAVVYTAFPLGMSGRQRQSVSFEGRARYDASSLTAKITLFDVLSGY